MMIQFWRCAAVALTCAAGSVAATAAPVRAPAPRLPLILAQGDYLPPSERRGAGDDTRPRRIEPRRDAPAYDDPPPRRDYDDRRDNRDYGDRRDDRAGELPPRAGEQTYSSNEIVDAGHRFFGTVSQGLADVVQYVFQRNGRPSGYILGDEGSGAVVIGLRYGEGTLYTKYAGPRRIFWQGPSLGYDVGGDGSKVMTLVYHLDSPGQLYQRFGGVDGSAYLVGGVGVTFLTADNVVLAPIRSGVGVRFGANIGYLKFTDTPTWNPF